MASPATPLYLNFTRDATSGWYTIECVTSAQHNLKSGQQVVINSGGSGTFSVSKGASSTLTGQALAATSFVVWVTGLTTFVILQNNGQLRSTAGGLPGMINTVAGSFAVSYTATVYVPDQKTFPPEAACAATADLPGCGLWINVPPAATDACVAAWAQRVRDNFPAGRKVYVENGNEHFNTARPAPFYYAAGDELGLWGTAGLGYDQAYALRTAQMHQIFYNVFQQRDINGVSNRGSEIVRLFGSWFVSPTTTQNVMSQVNASGLGADAFHVAAYIDVPAPSTSPATAATVSVGGSGGSLPVGNYYVYYTWVDSVTKIETDVGTSGSAVFPIASSGQVPTVTIPAFGVIGTKAAWGSGTTNIYLTQPGGAPGTATLYLTGQTGTSVQLTSSTWAGVSTSPPAFNLMPSPTVAAAKLATHWPTSIAYGASTPWTRKAYWDVFRHFMAYNPTYINDFNSHQSLLATYTGGTMPQLVGYEGSIRADRSGQRRDRSRSQRVLSQEPAYRRSVL